MNKEEKEIVNDCISALKSLKLTHKKDHRLYVGVYESITNAQAEIIATKPIFVNFNKLEDFMRTKFRNFSKITFISTEKNEWISCKKIDYKEYEKFEELEGEQQ